ncbi:MAG: type II toxin-antitoxin system VapC family toxin [Chloroflexi bacterium]|nr:type II toxin-antitoxin system VapC family toxin [Chloroflexota bacterium]
MTDLRPVYALDSFALLAFFQREPGAEAVADLLRRAAAGEVRLLTTIVNVAEVVYRTIRQHGDERARDVLARIDDYAVELVDVDRRLALAAALVKGHHPMAYADCLIVALAQRLGATVVTGDPEFRRVAHLVAVDWLATR